MTRAAWTTIGGTALLVAYCAVVRTDALPWLRGPAPYPPDWQWPYTDRPLSWTWAPAIALGLVLVGFYAWLGRRAVSRAAATLLLVAATAVGWAFHIALTAPSAGGAMHWFAAQANEAALLSHFNAALSPDLDDAADYLDRYAERLPDYRERHFHVSSRPPGLVLAFRALIEACAARPAICRRIVDRLPMTAHDRTRLRSALPDVLTVAAILGILVTALFCVLALWPIAALARAFGAPRGGAVRIAILWPLVPGAALFLGTVDTLVAPFVAFATLALVRAGAAETRGSAIAWGTLAGVAGALSLHVTYGTLLFAVIGIGVAACAPGRSIARGSVGVAAAVVCGTALFAVPVVWGYDPIAAFRASIGMHGGLTAARDRFTWLVFNAIDYASFLGAPLALCAFRLRRDATTAALACVAVGLVGVTAAGLVLGEVGRIWIPAMPLTLVALLAGRRGGGGAGLAIALLAVTITLRVSWFG